MAGDRAGATGIGLGVCKNTVKAHGETKYVRSGNRGVVQAIIEIVTRTRYMTSSDRRAIKLNTGLQIRP